MPNRAQHFPVNGLSRHMKSHGHGQVEAWVDLDSMDEPKLMATYFRNFDLDKNGRIDGLELLKSMQKMNGALCTSCLGLGQILNFGNFQMVVQLILVLGVL